MQLLLYPTAIGSEPQDPTLDSYAHWATVMKGHAGANLVELLVIITEIQMIEHSPLKSLPAILSFDLDERCMPAPEGRQTEWRRGTTKVF